MQMKRNWINDDSASNKHSINEKGLKENPFPFDSNYLSYKSSRWQITNMAFGEQTNDW